ncbi:MAG: hypothetical protein LC648_04790, partial [Novosphingobium sp.]|nr:hypothetical protein [Novosphingobium sp.]
MARRRSASSGLTAFGGAVGAINALSSLTANGGGTTALNGGSVRTTGGQTYADAVTIDAATTLTSTADGAIDFASTLDGAQTLALNTGGLTIFRAPVGGMTALTSLTTDAPGTTTIHGGSVITTGAQAYNDAVTLSADTTLSSTMGGAIGFGSTVDSDATARALTVTTSGLTTFGGAVGATNTLSSLTANGGGTTALDGGLVRTIGGQTYSDAVMLGAATVLNSTGNGTIDFAGTLDGAQTLAVNTGGLTLFRGPVGAGTALTSLTTDAPGTTTIHGGTVNTTGAQTYNDAVTLSADTTLNAGTDIAFAAALDSLDGGQSLTANAGGAASFNGVTGGAQPLESLTVTATSALVANATVTNAAQITSIGLSQIGSLSAGSIALDGGQVTGLGAGEANLAATGGDVTVTAGTLARLGTVSASGTGSDIVVTGDVVSVDSATAGGLLSLAADVGNLTLGTGNAGTTATLTKTGAAGELAVTGSVTGGTGVTLSSATDARIANATATTGNLAATASGALTGVSGGRANLTASTDAISASAGTTALLGAVNAGTSASLSAGGLLDATTVTAGTDATLSGASVVAGTVTATNGALSLTATAGDATLGTGNAGTTATLSAVGDIVLTSKLVAGGDIALTAGDDVFIAEYDATADTGLIRSTAGDVAIDANGSVVGIGAGENTLPTSQRGVAALSTSGNLTINSDGDARFDSLSATGSVMLDIAGSLTGAPLTGGTSTGINVPGGAVFAQGAGGDVTIRSGLAGAPVLDTVVLNRVVADRNISISADQLAVGRLTTNSGTITLNDTSGAALSGDNYYVGQLNASGDLVVVLTGQPTAAIPLVALDANGAPESFDAA